MSTKPLFSLVLCSPEIPGNTGSIGRTCLALNLKLILIHPLGFDISEKAVRRAGLDYWKHVNIVEYQSWDDFLFNERPNESQLYFLESNTGENVLQAQFEKGCYLVFGGETKSISNELLKRYQKRVYQLPMTSEYIRSINLSNAATTVAYLCYKDLSL